MNLTKELKEAWLDALRSGKYIQFQRGYRSDTCIEETGNPVRNCCLSVLDLVATKMYGKDVGWPNNYSELISLNDEHVSDFVPDYRNVIPFIEKLETID